MFLLVHLCVCCFYPDTIHQVKPDIFAGQFFSRTNTGCLKNDTFNYELFSGLSPTPESFFLARCSAKNASSYS